MSILINMEMPKNERYVDVRIFADGRATTAAGERPFYKEMDVIELPPHGRLIDADELKKHKKHSEEFAENIVAVAQIDWMPTVIPADKDGGE